MFSRFTRAFIAIVLTLVREPPFYAVTHTPGLTSGDQFLVASLGMVHPRSKPYFDPWSGDRFGEGGVEQHFAIKPSEELVKGKPIMQKLGNETAKSVLVTLVSFFLADNWV